VFRNRISLLSALPFARSWLVASVGTLALLVAGVLGYVLFVGGNSEAGALPAVQASPTASPSPAPTEAPAAVPTPPPPPAPTPLPPPLSESHRMIIERIGVDAPTVTYGLDENRVPIVPTGGDASLVVAWYDFSARPGTGGNAVYAGHVTWNGAAVFYNLSTLGAGDLIRLRDDRGAEVVYQVTANFQIDPNDPNAVQVLYPLNQDVITIITCGGSFYSTGDPVFGGDYSSRTIIRAELVGITRV